MWILDKLTSSIGWIFGTLSFVFGTLAVLFFKAWSKSKEELKEERAKREFEKEVVEKAREAKQRLDAQKAEQAKEKEQFNEEIDNGVSISDAVRLHNDKVQESRD